MIATSRPGVVKQANPPFTACVCGGVFFVNDRCVACRGIWQARDSGRNNTVVTNEDFAETKPSRLRRCLQQNTEEYYRLLAELKKTGVDPPPREDRGLFTKKILERVDRRFPSHPTRRSRRAQKR